MRILPSLGIEGENKENEIMRWLNDETQGVISLAPNCDIAFKSDGDTPSGLAR